ncbi:putative DDE superfamily endonuclease [Monocercomonoides exilis]|uniref:putative DDE superfamily endonuclease n=1 Tax=Monocercomonoides exilis TaxID=2049356 RepID=UPI00355A5893|nr:putative DDE superfamily endonuclease [Monocercomonoides exilis]|eukprot:MONOS_13552.1-p1 / transcript=MONOS_13552.1 / gene=MONOS_13552 / organism=Monocercomonoides_exilis_PA203 / gene_product=unspecified product / transcript_product=unspecified product / location=Mono_scaffold00844:1759-2952(-) / protein_length=397 / sequence_SO=supercontig / SO=protein_coding / is_pseudo=false
MIENSSKKRTYESSVDFSTVHDKIIQIFSPNTADTVYNDISNASPSDNFELVKSLHSSISIHSPAKDSCRTIAFITPFGKTRVDSILNTPLEQKSKQKGKPLSIDAKEEEKLVKLCIQKYDEGDPFTQRTFLDYVNQTYEKTLTYNYSRYFLKRYQSNLDEQIATPLESKRYVVTQDSGLEYKNKLTQKLDGIRAELIFCMDETGVQEFVDSKKRRVICPKEIVKGSAKFKVNRDNRLVSVIGCIPLIGFSVKPMLLIKRQTIDEDTYSKLILGLDLEIRSSPKGYSTSIAFVHWINDCFIPHINKIKTNINEKTLLLADGHSSHSSQEANDLLLSNNIDLFFIPPHSSHLLSPLDLTTFSIFKREIRRLSTIVPSTTQAKLVDNIVRSYQTATVPY